MLGTYNLSDLFFFFSVIAIFDTASLVTLLAEGLLVLDERFIYMMHRHEIGKHHHRFKFSR